MPSAIQENPTLIEMQHDGEPLLGHESVLGAVCAQSPELVIPQNGWLRHVAGKVQSLNGAENTATFVVVTRSGLPNRNGNAVQITAGPNGYGMRTDEYDLNPVVLYNHGEISIPIGTGSQVLKFDDKAIATVKFSELPHAELIGAAVQEGLMRMSSIGFIVEKAMRLKKPQEMLPEDVQDWKYVGYDFVQSVLMEWSVVPIGADAGALRQAVERGSIAGVKMSTLMKWSLSHFAEKPKAWSPGATLKRQEIQSLGVTIEGAESSVAAAVQRLEQVSSQEIVVQTTAKVIDETPKPVNFTVSAEQVASQVAQVLERDRQHEIVQQQIVGTVLECFRTECQQAVEPIAKEIQDLSGKLRTALGRKPEHLKA